MSVSFRFGICQGSVGLALNLTCNPPYWFDHRHVAGIPGIPGRIARQVMRTKDTLTHVLHLAVLALGGAAFVVASDQTLRCLKPYLRLSDDGYLNRKLRHVHASSPEFIRVVEVVSKPL